MVELQIVFGFPSSALARRLEGYSVVKEQSLVILVYHGFAPTEWESSACVLD